MNYSPSAHVPASRNSRGRSADCTRAGDVFRQMTADAQDSLTTHIANAMRAAPAEIQVRQVAYFMKADLKYGALVAVKLAQKEAPLDS